MEQDILKQILSELKELKTGQQEMNERLDNIEKDTVHIKQAVSEVNREVIATSEQVQQLQEMAQDHKVALDILAARSLEQEVKFVRSR